MALPVRILFYYNKRDYIYTEVIYMLQTVTTTGYQTNYTDISNNTYAVKHSVILSTEHRKELEERIVEEIYRVFTHKSS